MDHFFLLNLDEYLKYHLNLHHHNLYYHISIIKSHRHTHIIESFSYHQLKNLLKHCQNIMEQHLFQVIMSPSKKTFCSQDIQDVHAEEIA